MPTAHTALATLLSVCQIASSTYTYTCHLVLLPIQPVYLPYCPPACLYVRSTRQCLFCLSDLANDLSTLATLAVLVLKIVHASLLSTFYMYSTLYSTSVVPTSFCLPCKPESYLYLLSVSLVLSICLSCSQSVLALPDQWAVAVPCK